MLFSVVIPTYNRAEMLSSALRSVLDQEFNDYEVIVVDDGSTDHTEAVVQSHGGRVRYLRTDNNGPGPARNAGARMAAGDYLAFLDSDDLWFPWTLSVFASLIRDHHSPSILSAQITYFRNEQEALKVPNQAVEAAAFRDYFSASHTGYFVGAGMAVLRRDTFLKCGGFTHHLINGEDHDLILRLGTAPGFVQVITPKTLACQRHEGNVSAIVHRSVQGILHLIAKRDQGHTPEAVRDNTNAKKL